jgi:hypothetical protein
MAVRCVLLSLFGFALVVPYCAKGEVFRVPLNPSEQTAPLGSYISAPFDFGTGFLQIDSVTLEFMMPGGYEGYAVTTGNSSSSRWLHLVLHDTETVVPNIWANSGTTLASWGSDIEDNELAQFAFKGFLSFGQGDTEPVWPDFILGGTGRVSWVDEFHSSYHPLPDGVGGSSSTSWLIPGEIVSAQLTIVGTPVPEASSVTLLAVGALTVFACRMWMQRRLATCRTFDSGA